MQLGMHRRWDSIGLRHIVEPGRAIHGDAIVQVFEGLIDSQLLPLRANAAGIVHDVAHSKDELRAGALRLERIEAVAELALAAQRLMIYQHQFRAQPERGFAQYSSPYAPEMSYGFFFFF